MQRVQEITGGEGAYAALDPVAGDFTSTVSRMIAVPHAVECMPPRKLGQGRLGTGPMGSVEVKAPGSAVECSPHGLPLLQHPQLLQSASTAADCGSRRLPRLLKAVRQWGTVSCLSGCNITSPLSLRNIWYLHWMAAAMLLRGPLLLLPPLRW